jgi:hypothetical protein
MVEPQAKDVLRLPENLFQRMRDHQVWKHLSPSGQMLGLTFRTTSGRRLDLIVDRTGAILAQNVQGELDGPRSPEMFDFNPDEICTWLGRRKVRTGWLPWQYRWEEYELLGVASSI